MRRPFGRGDFFILNFRKHTNYTNIIFIKLKKIILQSGRIFMQNQ